MPIEMDLVTKETKIVVPPLRGPILFERKEESKPLRSRLVLESGKKAGKLKR